MLTGRMTAIGLRSKSRAIRTDVTRFCAHASLATLLTLAVSARAEPLSPSKPSEALAQGSDDPRTFLAPGDRLTVSVFDQPDLSGTYFVGPSGDMSFPLLGSVLVEGLSTTAVQAAIAARLGDGFIQDPTVIVRLAELRPVTVVGAVRTPGRYNFLEGMTIAAALALSGGPALLNSEEAQARADYLAAQERLNVLKVAYIGQLARRARFEASLAKTDIVAPQVDATDAALLADFVAVEKKVLFANRDALKRQRAVLSEQIKQIAADIEVFGEQITLENGQLNLLDGQLAASQKLLENGLTRKANVIDLQRERSRSRSNLAQLSGSLTRARSLQVEAQFRLEQLETTTTNGDLTGLQAVNQQVAETETALPLSQDIRNVRRMRVARLPQEVSGPQTIRLTRFQNGAFKVSEARPDDPVWPGDIIQVGPDATGFAVGPIAPVAPPASIGEAGRSPLPTLNSDAPSEDRVSDAGRTPDLATGTAGLR